MWNFCVETELFTAVAGCEVHDVPMMSLQTYGRSKRVRAEDAEGDEVPAAACS